MLYFKQSLTWLTISTKKILFDLENCTFVVNMPSTNNKFSSSGQPFWATTHNITLTGVWTIIKQENYLTYVNIYLIKIQNYFVNANWASCLRGKRSRGEVHAVIKC